MREIIHQLQKWHQEGKPIALATVVSTWGSAPRKAGSHMAITEDGLMAGSVSGGCVEGAVVDKAMRILKGDPPELLHFGVQDETAWDVGLACGGEIDVFVGMIQEDAVDYAAKILQAGETLRMGTIVKGPASTLGKRILLGGNQNSGGYGMDDALLREFANIVGEHAPNDPAAITTTSLKKEDYGIFLQSIAPSPTLILVGGAHIAIALAEMAKLLGYRTVVIDPRKAFASHERFAHVDVLIPKWPQEALEDIPINSSTAVVTLTHDPKIDDPALATALRSEAFYVGALGSRKTHQKRLERLSRIGLQQSMLERIHGPVGLDIGADSPEEIALAIMAELTSVRRNVGA